MLIFSTKPTVMTNEFDKQLESKFISKEKFTEDIEKLVQVTKLNYIDAIVEYCSTNGIEIESVSKLISKPLKEKLRYDATELNYLKQPAQPKLKF
ncbi:late promoter transcriptional accessory protein [Synechococcus phage S-CRM01]|uniref:late promoter transcriptional regulator n=1 Tax=Synechococcus phage S-CRM01 TaxID=1026955 RepID=UPI000209E387|nr:late promoter transcriptional regulator [Synechococcus phage S-CRM01]AEC53021.1 late promoter transcriptional accessory protein [Synechococcus phage S-CRM01]